MSELLDLGKVEASRRCAADPVWFMETCLRIVPKEGGGIVPLRLNEEQVRLMAVVWERMQAQEPVRVLVLKGRQLGVTTYMQGLGYWLTTTRPNMTAMVVSHERPSAEHILGMAHGFHDWDARHEAKMAPEKSRASRRELRFDNPDWRTRWQSSGLGSSITVATADNRYVGHSQTLQFFHGSEVSRWPRQELLSGILEALPLKAGTFGFLESTANGAAGVFYDMWRAATDSGGSEWSPVFLSWVGRPEYRIEFKAHRGENVEDLKRRFAATLTSREVDLMNGHRLDLEQIGFRRAKIRAYAEDGGGRSPESIFQESYPLTPDEAFVSTGAQFFDMARVVRMETESQITPWKDGLLVGEREDGYRQPSRLDFVERRWAPLRVWQPPENDRDYVIGADVAAGVRGGDFSVAYVMDRERLKIVARYRAQLPPPEYAKLLVLLAWYYNRAFLAPEANSVGMDVARYCSINYTRLCYAIRLDRLGVGDSDPDRPGWWTTHNNRRHMYASLRQALADGSLTVHCPDFLREAKDFIVVRKQVDGKLAEDRPQGRRGRKDDTVSAMAITWWVNDPMIAGPIKRVKATRPRAKTWFEAALAADIDQERKKPKHRDYDEHVGFLG